MGGVATGVNPGVTALDEIEKLANQEE